MKKTFKIDGMHCNSCSTLIENELKEKVNKIQCNYAKGEAVIDFNEEKISETEIKETIKKLGYTPGEEKENKSFIEKLGFIIFVTSLVVFVFVMYKLITKNYNLEIPVIGESGSLLLLFFVGILTGFHCISMCGGFVVSYTAKNAIKGHKGFRQHLVYGISKVASYTIIGGIFGLIGGIFAFSILLRGSIAILAGTFMIFYALSMMGIKFFRKFQFNPKFLTKIASKGGKTEGVYKRPFVIGLLSGLFIACGPLQAMYLYAAGTGDILSGMGSLAAFGLGTLPIMLGFGSLATVISKNTTQKILKISAVIVLILGVIMLNRGLTVMGSPVSYDAIKETIIQPETGSVIIKGDYQEVNMEVNRYGWKPNSFVLKKGVPVKWNINVKELTGCNNEIIVNEYGLDIKLKEGLNVVEFVPEETGTVRWSCWMGMIPGSFIVTESGDATQEQLAASAPQASGSCGGSCGSPTCGAATGGGCGCGG